MARIPTDQLNRIKSDISLLRLVESQGFEITKQGKDSVVKCPFHDDDTPSCVISPKTNLFHCFGCGAGGSVIDWVMKTQGVSFRLACELLLKDVGAVAEAPTKAIKKTTAQKLSSPLAADLLAADAHQALSEVIEFYHQTLLENDEALAYLEKRGLNDEALINEFKLGYANRTLAYHIPQNNREAGGKIREQLKQVGILRKSGHEHFNGSLVVPVIDQNGNITEVYGRKTRDDLTKGTPKHLYLPGAHTGVFNEKGLKNQTGRSRLPASRDTGTSLCGEVILCESLIDAMTFWVHGFKNVTTSYGTQGFTADLLAAFKQHGIQKITIAYDRDEAGNTAAESLAEQLQAEGFECWRVLLPLGMDVNQYAGEAQSKALARDRLEQALRKAEWVSGVGDATQSTALRDANDSQGCEAGGMPHGCVLGTTLNQPGIAAAANKVSAAAPPADVVKDEKSAAFTVSNDDQDNSTPLAAQSITTKLADEVRCEVNEREVLFDFSGRVYRVRGLAKNTTEGQLKVNVTAIRTDHGDHSSHPSDSPSGQRDALCKASVLTLYHTDTLELYHAKQRQVFINQTSIELGVEHDVVKADMGKVLLKLEALQDEQRQDKSPDGGAVKQLTSDEQAQALELLKDPNLLQRILDDFNQVGLIGEDSNKLVGYLACVSRKLPKPLGVVIQSSSAAGKSSLMDAILNLMPEEERVSYSAMTGQSLYYLGETYLKNKILAIAEEEGAHNASYALKLLQSEGEVKIASTGKDETTGDLVTKEYRVEGPTQLFMTTTAIDVDPELMNRCLVLSVDEGREQTEAIHQQQRYADTLDGLFAYEETQEITALHRNAQRLLKPLKIVNPYAGELTFISDKTRTRRDHVKYLTLIKTITLLHQYQRELKTETRKGRTVEYIEVTLADIEAANQLAHQVLGRTLDELPPQARKLLDQVHGWVNEQCQAQSIQQSHFRFSRRQIRELCGWGETQVRLYLQRLTDMEYLLIHRGTRGQSFEYELLYAGEGKQQERFLLGMLNVDALKNNSMTTTSREFKEGSRGGSPQFAGSSRPLRGGFAGGSRQCEMASEARANGASHPWVEEVPENCTSGPIKSEPVVVSAQS